MLSFLAELRLLHPAIHVILMGLSLTVNVVPSLLVNLMDVVKTVSEPLTLTLVEQREPPVKKLVHV